MPAFLTNIEEIRSVDWGRTHLWSVSFGGDIQGNNIPPEIFKRWFPAVTVTENLLSLNSKDFKINNTSVKIPEGTQQKDIQMSFYDNANYDLLNWLEEWANSINGNGEFILTMEEAARKLYIQKLDKNRNVVKTSSYLVYPDGLVAFSGVQEGGIPLYTMTFIVAATL